MMMMIIIIFTVYISFQFEQTGYNLQLTYHFIFLQYDELVEDALVHGSQVILSSHNGTRF